MIKGVIFDMDGVISDTQKLHARVESDILARYGVHISAPEITRRYAGVRTQEFFADLLLQHGCTYDLDSLLQEKWQHLQALAAEGVDPKEGALGLIQTLHYAGYPLAVASAAHFNFVKTVLEGLELHSYFKAIISGDRVEKGKPDPETFLLASEKLYVSPPACLVLEDSVSGMEAAVKAHMTCIGLVNDISREYPTPHLVTSLKEVTLEYIRSL